MKNRFINFLNKHKKLNKAIATFCMCCVFIVGGCALPSYAVTSSPTANSYIFEGDCITFRVDSGLTVQPAYPVYREDNNEFTGSYSFGLDSDYTTDYFVLGFDPMWSIPYSEGYNYYLSFVLSSDDGDDIPADMSCGVTFNGVSLSACYNVDVIGGVADDADTVSSVITLSCDITDKWDSIGTLSMIAFDFSEDFTFGCANYEVAVVIHEIPKSTVSGVSVDYTDTLNMMYGLLSEIAQNGRISNVYLENYLVPLNETLTVVSTTLDDIAAELLEQGATLDSINKYLYSISSYLFDIYQMLYTIDYNLADMNGMLVDLLANSDLITADVDDIRSHTTKIVSYLGSIRDALISGNDESQNTITEFENSSDNLSTTITDYNATQESFYSDFETNQAVIMNDVKSWDWGGLVDCANWIGFTLTDYYNNMGDFKQYIIYPLMLGIALFFLGRGDSIIGHLYRKPTATFTHTETRSTMSGGVKHTNTVTQREGGVFRK